MKFNLALRVLTCLSVLVGAGLAASAARAQAYPSKSIRLIVPFPAGGATDVLARLLAQSMTVDLGQPVVVDNRPGAGGRLGADVVAKSSPDGYTLLVANGSFLSLAQVLYPALPYDAVKSFSSIGIAARFPMSALVSAAVPIKSLTELVAYANANPGKLNYGSIGSGSIPQMVAEHFRLITRSEMVHVPYRGAAPMVTALIAGEIQLTFDLLTAHMLELVNTGKVRALAVLSTSRNPQVPSVPTALEAGVPDLMHEAWFGLSAPSGTPNDVVTRLNGSMRKAMVAKETVDAMKISGMIAGEGTPDQMDREIKSDIVRWGKINEVVRLKLE